MKKILIVITLCAVCIIWMAEELYEKSFGYPENKSALFYQFVSELSEPDMGIISVEME